MSEPSAAARGAAVRFLALAVAVALADQAVKALIVRRLALGETRPLLGSLLSLTRAANTGAAFGMFSWASAALAAVGAVLVLALVVWGIRSAAAHPELLWPLALILGGALGNLLDRIVRGNVVDYLDLHFWPVFNLADSALTVGVFWFALRMLLAPPAPRPDPTPPGEETE